MARVRKRILIIFVFPKNVASMNLCHTQRVCFRISENATTSNQVTESTIHDFRKAYLELKHDELLEMAHQPSEMIIECIYMKRIRHKDPVCTELIKNGGTKIFSPTYGVCYMFNFKGLNEKINGLSNYMSGEEYGLQLTLNVESKYRSYSITNSN